MKHKKLNIEDANPPVSTFEAWLDLSPGTHQVEIEAEDYSGNLTQETYEVNVSASGDPWVFTYDLNGNITKRERGSEVIEYEWDADAARQRGDGAPQACPKGWLERVPLGREGQQDRLIAIDHDDGTRSEFVFDGFGRRVRITEKNSSGGTIEDHFYLWDGLEIIEKRDTGTGNVLRRYFSLGMEVVSGSDAGDYFYRFDHLGSIRDLTNDSGTVVTRYDYDPYGRVTQTSGTFESDFLFTGHFYHERSGLHLAPYRAYDAELGRWLNRDPLATMQPDGWAGPEMIHTLLNGYGELLPEGPNLYGYGPNDPINGFDPDGQYWIWGALGGMAWEVGMQALTHGTDFRCYSVGDIMIGGLQGALGWGAYRNIQEARRGMRAAREVRGNAPGLPWTQPVPQSIWGPAKQMGRASGKGLGGAGLELLKRRDCEGSGSAGGGTGGGGSRSGPVWNAPSVGGPIPFPGDLPL